MSSNDDKSKACCCPIYKNMELLTKKWTFHILRVFSENKTLRFSAIQEALPEINSRILSERLSDLEELEMVARNVQGSKPIVIEYEITEKGKDFAGVLKAFCTWSKKWK